MRAMPSPKRKERVSGKGLTSRGATVALSCTSCLGLAPRHVYRHCTRSPTRKTSACACCTTNVWC